jgi:hypothetical protein
LASRDGEDMTENCLQSRGYSVVAFDAYGCGASPKPRDWKAYSKAEMLEGWQPEALYA